MSIKWPWKKEKEEAPRPAPSDSSRCLLWYPEAKIPSQKMKTKGKYEKGYPRGAVVHFTAGGNDPQGTLSWGREMGYCYFVIDRQGIVYQSFPLNEWGQHAGESRWMGVSSLSRHFVGIEVIAAGQLKKVPDKFSDEEAKYAAWFHYVSGTNTIRKNAELFKYDEVRFSSRDMNIQPGIYHKFSDKQEESLMELLLWLKRNNPNVFKLEDVVGHDEIAPLRKNDPGAALSMNMHKYRAKLNAIYYGDSLP